MESKNVHVSTIWRAAVAATLMVFTSLATASVQRASAPITTPDIEAMLPESFGDWRQIPLTAAVLPQETDLGPGEAVAYRAYQDDLGRVVTLVAAYGPPLGDSVRLHRPEKCYVAQGFSILDRRVSSIIVREREIDLVHMQTENPTRHEAVSYWLRSGAEFITTPQDGQLINFRRGFAKPLDGALIRVSSAGSNDALFGIHETFLGAFSIALDSKASGVLLGEDIE